MSSFRCPCCGVGERQNVLCPATFDFGSSHKLVECNNCGNSYFYPVPAVTNLQTFYSTHGYEFNPYSQAARARYLASNYLRTRPTGRFLDIGCATGFLLKAIREETRLEVYGVELVEKAANFAKINLNLGNVLNTDLAGAAYPTSFFDVIHISEVLEHVPDPVSLLTECQRILKPGGLFFLSLPNGVADRQGLLDYWHRYHAAPGHASGHIFFFSKNGLTELLGEAGFRIADSYTSAFKQGLRTVGFFPKRRNWERMFESRKEREVPLASEITFPIRKHSDRFYRIKYGARERLKIPGLHRFGLAWHLVLRKHEA